MSLQKIFMAALSGVVIGLLIAPARGRDTRQKLSASADSIKRKIRRLRGTTNDELDELHQVFEHEISGLRDDMRERILKLIDASKTSYNQVISKSSLS